MIPQALAAGHTVTAVARNPAAITIQHERLTVVQGDVLEPYIERTRLPVPEPEAQPSQRPAADSRPQRPIRRMDPKALDLPRGNRSSPPGDVIDIPAFLRKR